MSGHTPGPWKVYRSTYATPTKPAWSAMEELRIGTADNHPQLKAPVPVVTTTHGLAGTHIYIRERDANLIAAAPDLYKQLRHLVLLLEPLERDGRLDVPGLATLNGARAALAKADDEPAAAPPGEAAPEREEGP